MGDPETLTQRQQQIVSLTCDHDMTMKEISVRLGIAYFTVKNHKSLIMEKLDAHSMHRVCCIYGQWKAQAMQRLIDKAIQEFPAMRPELV